MKTKFKLLIVVGLSGSGKTSVMSSVEKKVAITKIPTCTSRLPRDGEVEGIDYFFKPVAFFENNNSLIAPNLFGGNYYGIDPNVLEEHLLKGHCYIIVDKTGFLELKERFPDALSILIDVDLETVSERILKRDKSVAVLNTRMKINETEAFDKSAFSYVVHNNNGKFEECVDFISSKI